MSFKIIDGDGPGKEERDRQQEERDRARAREWSENEFSWAIRETAANILRITRGAGKSYELLVQMRKTIDSAIKYQELHSHFPEISNYLRIEDEHERHIERARKGELDQATVERWWEDGTFEKMMAEHTIMRGAFQTVASQLVDQSIQKTAGERELHDGILSWLRARDAQREKRRLAALAESAAVRSAKPKKKKPKPRGSKQGPTIP